MNPQQLQQHILQLARQADHMAAHLDVLNYAGVSVGMCTCKHCADARKATLQADLEALIRKGREALFDLYVSGISHRAYVRFIEAHTYGN